MAIKKIALDAGHWLGEPRLIPKALDSNETREWWLNDRVCDRIEKILSGYTGYELLRIDDTTGAKEVDLIDRTNKANSWGADVFISVHHNGGANLTNAGGVVAFSYSEGIEGAKWRDDLYDAIIANGGLRGNRSSPKAVANYHVLRETNMAACLLELGFMDSKIDAPIILKESYATLCAEAIVKVLVQRLGLLKKEIPSEIAERDQPQKWSEEARAWAEKAGIITGFADGSMRYNEPVTREQMVVFLHRLWNLIK